MDHHDADTPDAVVAALSRVNAALTDLTIGPLERAAVAKWAARLFEQADLDSSRDSRAVRLRELIEEKLRRHRSGAEPEAPIDRAASKVVGVMLTGLAILFGLLILVPLALFIFGR